MAQRFFEVISAYKDAGINLPKRATKQSAGYDFEAAETVVIPGLFSRLLDCCRPAEKEIHAFKPTLVPTGIKVCMPANEMLNMYNRSGNPLKKLLLLSNGVGVIDADYYNNSDNEGHIQFAFWHFGFHDRIINKGDRIGQGIFVQFLTVDNEEEITTTREGGFGHTK